MSKQLIVIGGGAAGFFCAINAARLNPNLQVTILEKTSKLLSKVRVSGGGRCNVTHACFDIPTMSRQYPRGGNFVKKTFHQFFTTDTINWFEQRGVKLKTESDGRMFPVTDSSQTIIDCLLKEANMLGVSIIMNAEVKSVNAKAGKFELLYSRNTNSNLSSDEPKRLLTPAAPAASLRRPQDSRLMTADYICVACGGYPKPAMFNWLTALGHLIEDPVPSLFTFNMPGHSITKLMGVSVDHAKVKIVDSKLLGEGPLLITHWGLSGPAVLRLSAWGARELQQRNWEFGIHVNWLPDFNEQTLQEKMQSIRIESAAQKLQQRNQFGLPQRLWEYLVELSGIKPETRWADLPAKDQNRLIKNLCGCEFSIKGKTTYKEEFVTAGGIKLSEVEPNTMQSKLVPHLYFAGEILDVDGITGGFNFQHAWTSAHVAAVSIAKAGG